MRACVRAYVRSYQLKELLARVREVKDKSTNARTHNYAGKPRKWQLLVTPAVRHWAAAAPPHVVPAVVQFHIVVIYY